MYTRAAIMRRRLWMVVVPCMLVLAFTLSACGTNGTATGTAPGSTATVPGVTATPTLGLGTKDGCPNATVVATAPPTANVVLTNSNSGATVAAKKGDTIEVKLPFGHSWQGPLTISQDLLTSQGPTGYAYPTAKACVWSFVAAATGTAHLSFAGRPICQKNQACPMYVIAVLLTIDIK